MVLHPAPRFVTGAGMMEALATSVGVNLVHAQEEHGEILLTVHRDAVEDVLRLLRDEHEFQQLMEIAGVDFPGRAERFEVVYMLLSVTRNTRVMVKVMTDENHPVPTATRLWPNAGWLEREVFDMYGVLFDGNTDLRRILTDYGFEGHPFRKDFPLTGYSEMRYSEEDKRVIYEPVKLSQEFRSFEFASPWEGADYVLPGDEKAGGPPPVNEVKVTEKRAETGAGDPANVKAAEHVARGSDSSTVAGQGQGEPVPEETGTKAPGAPEPTEDRPDRAPRDEDDAADTPGATDIATESEGKD
ncbi:NADH dehydrogenase [Croceibacterium mercuriale]|uniref:NADH-quinone oxidoreductase subunit C n=2 Tax=Croceibacterium mercuriale TaxID=1572751 RepID=A0A0B2C410_9SPHN|nr:NADH dehydrogenase [Croceibacterium mercuriale]